MGHLLIIIKAPLPVVKIVDIVMLIKEQPKMVALQYALIPKQPPFSDVEIKFDHEQYFNSRFVVVAEKSTREWNGTFVNPETLEEIDNDCEIK